MLGRVRKAVFPAAGLGTRFLPATKAQPKEMLPLVDKPIIQYVIEEAVAAGLTNIIIVTGRGKNAIEDHFDVSYELERLLQERGKTDLLEQVRAISNMINVSYVRQGEALGLGHAVLVARDLVGDEPFAVMLGDDIIDSAVPCMKQMVDVFEQLRGAGDRRAPGAARRDLRLRRHRRHGHGGQRPRVPHPRPGREAERGRGAQRPRHHRPLHPDPRHLRGAGEDAARRGGRDPAHQRPAHAEATSGRCTAIASKASATTPATSSAS